MLSLPLARSMDRDGGPSRFRGNHGIDYPQHVASITILNSVYGKAPTLTYAELIELFATPGLKSLTGAMLQSPEQSAFVLKFQRNKFRANLAEQHSSGAFETADAAFAAGRSQGADC